MSHFRHSNCRILRISRPATAQREDWPGFARGTVFDDYLMTLSVDTDRKIEDQIYRDLDPNSLYSMYGDNSIVTYEAQSTSPVYAKIERDRSVPLVR